MIIYILSSYYLVQDMVPSWLIYEREAGWAELQVIVPFWEEGLSRTLWSEDEGRVVGDRKERI